jgi:hypothetical protein
MMTREMIRIGALEVPDDQVASVFSTYVNVDVDPADPFAYPYYDGLVTGSGSDDLNDGDLLAPTLLNAAPSIAGFASLQRKRTELIERLRGSTSR